MEYKIAAFDMDGTLLDSEKKIRTDSLEALTKAAAKGKYLCLSTGRNPGEIEEYRKQLPMMNYLMCISGALIIDNKTDETVFSKEFDHKLILKLFEIAKDIDAIIHLHGRTSHFQPQDLDRMKDYGMGVYRDMFEEVSIMHNNLFEEYVSNPYPVYKFNFYCKDLEQRAKAEAAVQGLPLSYCYSETKSFECSPLGISKASGLKYLCEKLGFSISQSIAVGDADNDVEIVKAAGLGIAMGNSNNNLLKAADVKVADCNSNGISQAINNYLLQK